MAIMHPAILTESQCTKSELYFYNQLKVSLSDKCHVFYSVFWFDKDENGQKVNSECDFLVFNPDHGFLAIEVKGGKSITVEDDVWTLHLSTDENNGTIGKRTLKKSPYKQARDSMYFFKSYLEEELESVYPGVFGHAVAFPFFNIEETLTPESPKELTIDAKDMGNLGRKINNIFHYSKPYCQNARFLSKDYVDKFIKVINKKIALSAAAGSLIDIKEKQLLEVNRVQDFLIDLLTNYKQAFLIGGAGTGKTWIAIKKAIIEAKEGRKTLFLCYNTALCEFIKTQISNDIECLTFESFMLKKLGGHRFNCVKTDTNNTKEFFDEIEAITETDKYDSIIVDEAQDFTEDWAMSVRLLYNGKGSLYVMYDKDQNIFRRDFKDGFLIDNPPYILRRNIRNTKEIHDWITRATNIGRDLISNDISAAEPEERVFTSVVQAKNYLNLILNRLVNKEFVECKAITIVSNRKKENSLLKDINTIGEFEISDKAASKQKSISYKTIQGFKGLESNVVIYLNHSYKNQPKNDNYYKTMYTACTRAKFFLYVVTIENE